jgi:Tfp pilus assembly protein PilX
MEKRLPKTVIQSDLINKNMRDENCGMRPVTIKGQALFFVLFLLAIFGALSGTLAVMWETQNRVRALDRDGSFALYLAQAGIEQAKIWARNNPGSPTTSVWINLGGGRYNFSVSGLTRDLSSAGQVQDGSGNTIAERQLSAQANAGYIALSAWSWREQ